MKICFYNTNHIGDIYFSSFFINQICKKNPTINFYYYSIHSDIFFKNIENLKKITEINNVYTGELKNGNPPEDLIDKTFFNTMQKW